MTLDLKHLQRSFKVTRGQEVKWIFNTIQAKLGSSKSCWKGLDVYFTNIQSPSHHHPHAHHHHIKTLLIIIIIVILMLIIIIILLNPSHHHHHPHAHHHHHIVLYFKPYMHRRHSDKRYW